jgi:WD40 repeat protein
MAVSLYYGFGYSSEEQNEIYLWKTTTGKNLHGFKRDDGWGGLLVFGPDGKSAIVGQGTGEGGAARSWLVHCTLPDCKVIRKYPVEKAEKAATTGKGKHLLYASTNRTKITLLDLGTGKELWTVTPELRGSENIALSQDATLLLTASGPYTPDPAEPDQDVLVQVWDATNGKCLRTLSGRK